ncbi:MAG: hypothetical protein JWO08_4551 [Verrucomicrobiaceae bacterium]|nr:hypothetical protein [Verrucomicrobiaceae bacterium]
MVEPVFLHACYSTPFLLVFTPVCMQNNIFGVEMKNRLAIPRFLVENRGAILQNCRLKEAGTQTHLFDADPLVAQPTLPHQPDLL